LLDFNHFESRRLQQETRGGGIAGHVFCR
jgi:hypothetical protein